MRLIPLIVILGVPHFSEASPPRSTAGQRLKEQCLLHAADVKSPWALAHGMTAFGKAFVAADGRAAADVIVSDFVIKATSPDGGATSGGAYFFKPYAEDGTPIEPHPNLLTKALVRAGLPPKTVFKTKLGPVTLDQLVQSAERGFRHTPSSDAYWHDAGWSLDLFTANAKPGAVIRTAAGPVDLDTVMDDALSALERLQADLKAGLDAGRPQVDKRKQGIYAHSCGGLHFVAPVLTWARHPAVRKRWGKRFDDQVAVLFYRFASERRQYDAVFQQAPQFRLKILVQQLKFYGHFLEVTGLLKAEVKWKASPQQRLVINTARAVLDDTVRKLEAMGAFADTDALRKSQPQIALDLIGDSCHASHGMELWK